MSHGDAAPPCNSLKQEGNSCDTLRHGLEWQKSQKALKTLAIPAGFEPATHGVEIRYSSRFLILIEKPKITSVRPTTDLPPKPREQTAIKVVNRRQR
jgi:hypothetical protein